MSASAGEKAFDATPSRIAKAKREGNVPRSQEFSANAALVAAGVTVAIAAPWLGAAARHAVAAAATGRMQSTAFAGIAAYALAPAAAAACAGVAAAALQGGGLTFAPIRFDASRLQPAEGFKRMLSREMAAHACRAAAAFAVAAAAIAPSLRAILGAALSGDAPLRTAAIAWNGAVRMLFVSAAVGMAFAVAEYASVRRAWLRKLKMSFEEFKRELKEQDGDPAVRGRRRSLHRSLLRGAIAKVKDASFVVVNPTHVAVALAYRPPEVPVPTVLVRAAGEAALRVREEAAAHRVPIVENVPLARALYRDGEPGLPIPHAHYVAVAEVVAALVRSGVLA